MSKNIHPATKSRLERLEELYNFIKKNNPTTLSKIEGTFVLKWGFTRRKLMEYLYQLSNAGKIKFDPYTEKVELA